MEYIPHLWVFSDGSSVGKRIATFANIANYGFAYTVHCLLQWIFLIQSHHIATRWVKCDNRASEMALKPPCNLALMCSAPAFWRRRIALRLKQGVLRGCGHEESISWIGDFSPPPLSLPYACISLHVYLGHNEAQRFHKVRLLLGFPWLQEISCHSPRVLCVGSWCRILSTLILRSDNDNSINLFQCSKWKECHYWKRDKIWKGLRFLRPRMLRRGCDAIWSGR